jgi:translocation and assembly module TamB
MEAGAIKGDISGGLRIDGLRYVNEGVEVAVQSLILTLNIHVFPTSVNLSSAELRGVAVTLKETGSTKQEVVDIRDVLQSLVLPIPVRVSDLRASDISISTGTTTQEIDSLTLSAHWFENIRIETLNIDSRKFATEASAAIDLRGSNIFSAEGSAQLMPSLTGLTEVLVVETSINGDPDSLDIESKVGSFATVEGSVSWRDQLVVVANVALERFDLSALVGAWPVGFPINGNIEVEANDASVIVNDSVLSVSGTDATVFVDAFLDRDSARVEGQLRWENLRWPIPDSESRVRSDVGDIQLAGSIDEWQVDGSIVVGTEEMPEGIFSIDVSGTRESVAGRIVEGRVFGGNVAGEVAYSWADDQPWFADLNISGIDLAPILPDFPGRVSGQIDGHGSMEPFALHATLGNVSGNIRGTELRASGVVDVENGGIEVRALRIEHGDSWLVLDGSPIAKHGLAFEASIADANAYNDDVSGALLANGSAWVKGAEAAIRFSLDSPEFAFRDFRFANLSVTAEGTHEQQSLHLSVVHLDTPLELGVTGSFDNWGQPLDSLWRGNIDLFTLDLGDQHAMTLIKAAPLELSTKYARFTEFCIGDETGSSLCANGTWNRSTDYSAEIQMRDMSVSVVEHLTETGLLFDQLVSGTLNWQYSDDRGARGEGRLAISPGSVRPSDDDRNYLATGQGIVDFEIEDGTLLSGAIEMPLPGTGKLSGSFSMRDVAAGANSEVTGRADIDVTDLRRLSRLLPLVDLASGSLRAGVELSGTIDTPNLAGDLVVENGTLRYMPIGLQLDEIDLTGRMNDDFRFDLSGTFRAGEGRAEITSSGDYGDVDQPGLHVHLRGDNLTLVNVPDVKVTANSDVELGLNRDTLSINGDLLVPMARIRPTNLATAKVSESEDVVIVEGELPDLPVEIQGGNGLQFTGELDVTLGDSVTINLDRARATVTGRAKLNWQGDVIPIANGRYDIAGSVQAFGQVLNITEGAVRFANVPADRPNLRVRAEREIFGNTQVKTAGVFVDGPVTRLAVNAYTMPPTTEERAMTLLVTGSDFDYEQGVGAIDFGTYIAPRLFISYGVGVFERENVISARYDITKGFGIKASSGSKESGVDLNYRFEN